MNEKFLVKYEDKSRYNDGSSKEEIVMASSIEYLEHGVLFVIAESSPYYSKYADKDLTGCSQFVPYERLITVIQVQ